MGLLTGVICRGQGNEVANTSYYLEYIAYQMQRLFDSRKQTRRKFLSHKNRPRQTKSLQKKRKETIGIRLEMHKTGKILKISTLNNNNNTDSYCLEFGTELDRRLTETTFDKFETNYLFQIFIHFRHFYSVPSSPLPLRGAPDYNTDTVSEFHAEAHRQLQVKDLPKVPT